MKAMFLTAALFAAPLFAAEPAENQSVYAPQAAEAAGLAAVEKAAIASPEFLKAREAVKKGLAQPSFESRTVVPYGGMRTYDPHTSYLVIERWYGFDSYVNVMAIVRYHSLPPGPASWSVKVVKLADEK